jgi:signal transduction histidine kinase
MSDTLQASAPVMESPSPEAPQYDVAEVIRHLAHELRQPLSTIESIAYYLEIILPKTDSKARNQVGKLQQMVHQSNWILADAIHFLQAAPPRPELTDLTELLGDSIAEWSAESSPEIRLSQAEALPLVRVDVGQVQHLLCNLFTYFEQISRGKLIRVRAWHADARVSLRISTDAPGSAADGLQSLFDPFSPHIPGGSGLALASVRRIAEVHHASLNAEWDPSDGMSVTVSFPAQS